MYKKQCPSHESLKHLNTFLINVNAKKIIFVQTIQSLLKTWKMCQLYNIPYIILGEGSNVLFLENYIGLVIINRIKGIRITEKKHIWSLHVFSGEKWHDFVKYTLRTGIFGLENLALIPGCVGSAVVQNIGAYGLELKNVCQYVDVISLKNGTVKRINAKFCKFSYRHSIFKNQYNNEHAIIAVGIIIKKKWNPIIVRSMLKYIQPKRVTAYHIFKTICKIRIKKLPNLKKVGNAGSFFKNPIITQAHAKKLISLYKNIPYQLQDHGLVKISAAWLIEKYQFKNIQIGGASIYKRQKLILINQQNATAHEIIQLAKIIQKGIFKKFNIYLQLEVDLITTSKKITSLNIST
ncbi:MAG: UDP-N-acetylmuramate dehydrogenase [Buchnera aphidicola (Pentalonia nigronervosa)]|jgi:UDP-N-acetylmuramate dehydrogenase|uniref:UDP-N-acetylenolpyruvoylglucosamine reductase n=1 Tax=Buchnera aphidicola (Pentalonia nigronervosa) TaxID=1309793 RepID=A0A7H1AZ90_9GAMM|nr:MAG: UDP-N-acetylmuramate dehydrogenase [Buchnera aphidicola (Pentalonia nigronervosa)]